MKLISAVKQKLKKKLVRTIYTAAKPYEIQVGDQPKLAGKTAVVTGGSGAIGRAVCVRLAAEGACVYVGGRREESVMKVVDEIRGHGLQAEPLLVDVTSADSIDAAFDGVFADRKLDVLVCCAGGGARSAMQELAKQSVEVLDSVLTTNLRGTMLCTRKAAQYMTPQGSGRIILISSAVGIQGKANYSEYAAAKAGILGFAKSIALVLGAHGITVNCVTPGFLQRGEYDDLKAEQLKKTNCLHTIGELEDAANAVCFLASDEAKFITGQSLGVDGGRTLGLYGD